jgi:hypothetical protein
MFALFGNPKEEVVAVFDIGNGSIGGSLVRITAGQPPSILYAHREPIAYMPHVTSGRLLDLMLKLLTKVAAHMRKDGIPEARKLVGHLPFNQAYCVFSSPWYVSQTHVLKVQKEQAFTVTPDFIDTLVQKEQEQFQESLREGKYEKVFGEDVQLFEKKIIHTRLNGYEVQEPVGKRVREVEVTFFSSFISKKILSSVESALAQIFHFRSMSYSSFALASWNAVRDIYPGASDFLFVDITTEVTDMALTIDGVLTETISFPLGRATLIRQIVEALLIPPEVALSFLDMYHKGTLEKKFADKVTQLLETALQKWHESFVQSLKNLQKFYVLPNKIYSTVDPDVEFYFTKALAEPVPKELNVPGDAFVAVIMNTEAIRQYIHHVPTAASDSFISIESIFVNKIARTSL